HRCTFVEGDLESLQPGAPVVAQVDAEFRIPTMRAHSSAHLLHSALKAVLGEHVEQAGSLVEPDRVRFDFKHFEAMSPDQVRAVDRLVNQWILEDCPVEKQEMPIAAARAAGAVALFGEKYGDTVRVVRMGDHSLELCGGTHLDHTSEIGAFVLVKEESIASGTRRVSGLTGQKAVEYFLQQEETVQQVAAELRAKRDLEEILAGIQRIKDEAKALRDEIAEMRAQAARGQLGKLLAEAERVGDTVLVTAQVPGASGDDLRTMATSIKDQAPSHAVLLIGGEEGKYSTLVMCSPDQVARGLKAGELIGQVGKLLGAGGGGRPDLAQGGGKDGTKIPEALA
ncbi:MAG TPA: DHHA1 domain-containing protein, partial [bacterium]|nr:DHHA1 domain-containing protein [bacterium]